MKSPNWLHCFADKKQEVDATNMIGFFFFSKNRIDRAANFMVDLEPEEVKLFTFEENLHYALFQLGILGKYCDSYFNVKTMDLTYAALKHDYKIMMLIDSKKKEKKVQEIAWELFQQWYDMTYISDELLLKKLSIKYSKRKEKLKSQLLKFNVLK